MLNSAHTAVTTSSSSAITPAELISLVKGVSNAAYAYKPTSGWLMNAETLNYIRSLTGSGSRLRVFPEKFDDDGDPLLEERKVYLCPNMSDIGASATPIAFGDMSRFWVRAVADSFTVFRFDEIFMPSHQHGYQAWWRAEGKVVSADGEAPTTRLRS